MCFSKILDPILAKYHKVKVNVSQGLIVPKIHLEENKRLSTMLFTLERNESRSRKEVSYGF